MSEDEDGTDEEGGRGPGRPRKELPGIGDNIDPVKKAIEKAIKDVGGLAQDREAINQKVQAIREDLFAKGIPKEAFDLVQKYVEWPEDKKRNFDLAYAICREAVGDPIQRDLFDNLD
ncbi:MAG: hypothetical protein OXT06_17550 [Rhodospirillaceae bacterium]|nr:hypothetical protein [Rhodospirillaceae bacterium]